MIFTSPIILAYFVDDKLLSRRQWPPTVNAPYLLQTGRASTHFPLLEESTNAVKWHEKWYPLPGNSNELRCVQRGIGNGQRQSARAHKSPLAAAD